MTSLTLCKTLAAVWARRSGLGVRILKRSLPKLWNKREPLFLLRLPSRAEGNRHFQERMPYGLFVLEVP